MNLILNLIMTIIMTIIMIVITIITIIITRKTNTEQMRAKERRQSPTRRCLSPGVTSAHASSSSSSSPSLSSGAAAAFDGKFFAPLNFLDNPHKNPLKHPCIPFVFIPQYYIFLNISDTWDHQIPPGAPETPKRQNLETGCFLNLAKCTYICSHHCHSAQCTWAPPGIYMRRFAQGNVGMSPRPIFW